MINSSVNIIDSPRFRHRGVMLDTARHFLPISIIKKNLVSKIIVNFFGEIDIKLGCDGI